MDLRYYYGLVRRTLRGKPKRRSIFRELRQPERDFDEATADSSESRFYRTLTPKREIRQQVKGEVDRVIEPIGNISAGYSEEEGLIGHSSVGPVRSTDYGRGRIILQNIWF